MRSATITNLLTSLSFGLFVLGISAPLMTVKQWLIFENTFSLLSGLTQFIDAEQYVLFVIVMLFSLALPLIKMLILVLVTNTPLGTHAATDHLIHGLSVIGKWSMMDVFIVAILVVVGKLRGIAEVEVHYGLYAFATSVILIHIATCLIRTGAKRTG